MTVAAGTGVRNLVLVAGHAVYVAATFDDVEDGAGWCLQPFQRGESPFYVEHMRVGVDLAHADPSALLVFSGGQTRREAGPRSEGDSYWLVANALGWWGHTELQARAAVEACARDSFENLLFGICRFRECAGCYPERITVVSWEFKRRRYDLHRAAIHWTDDARYAYVGANNPDDLADAERGELENALEPYRQDPYGTGVRPYELRRSDGSIKVVDLGAKRRERNPFDRPVPYARSCPELAGLLEHRGPAAYPRDQLPADWGWSHIRR